MITPFEKSIAAKIEDQRFDVVAANTRKGVFTKAPLYLTTRDAEWCELSGHKIGVHLRPDVMPHSALAPTAPSWISNVKVRGYKNHGEAVFGGGIQIESLPLKTGAATYISNVDIDLQQAPHQGGKGNPNTDPIVANRAYWERSDGSKNQVDAAPLYVRDSFLGNGHDSAIDTKIPTYVQNCVLKGSFRGIKTRGKDGGFFYISNSLIDCSEGNKLIRLMYPSGGVHYFNCRWICPDGRFISPDEPLPKDLIELADGADIGQIKELDEDPCLGVSPFFDGFVDRPAGDIGDRLVFESDR